MNRGQQRKVWKATLSTDRQEFMLNLLWFILWVDLCCSRVEDEKTQRLDEGHWKWMDGETVSPGHPSFEAVKLRGELEETACEHLRAVPWSHLYPSVTISYKTQ